MAAPVVHLNGTSAADLLAQRQEVYEAALALQRALCRNAPHMRDYPDTWEQADEDHCQRLAQVHALLTALDGEMSAIFEQAELRVIPCRKLQ